MNHFNPDQKRGHVSNAGRWAAHEHTAPEASLQAPPGPAQTAELPEQNRRLRGHKFFPADMRTWPALYANDATPLADQPFVAHYFVGGADWYISEIDPETGEAFGYTDLGLGDGEFGYIPMTELEEMVIRSSGFPQVVERDLDFQRGTLARQVIDKYKNAPAVVAV